MNVFKLRPAGRLGRLGRLLAGLGALVTMLVVTGTAALAAQVPPSFGGGFIQPPLAPAPAAAGLPGSQVALIAVGAALVAAVLAVLADRARAARRRPSIAEMAGNAPAQVSGVR